MPAPIAVAIDYTGKSLNWLAPVIKIGAIAGLTSVILVLILGQTRVFFTMATDGLLWKKFARVHPVYGTPYVATVLTGLVCAILAGLFPIGLLGEMVSIGTLLAFVIVCAGILILRKREPSAPRAFKTPLVPFVPIMGMLVCLAQMVSLPLATWIRLLGWMAFGFMIYFLYGRKHSMVRLQNRQV